jgi:carboxyl-terminal processing protease
MKKHLSIFIIAVSYLFADANDVSVNINLYLEQHYDADQAKEIRQIFKESSKGRCLDNDQKDLICTIPPEELVKIIEQDSVKGISVLKFPPINGEFGGLGLSIQEKPKKTFKVRKAFKGSPAYNKLQTGDEILEIDGVDVKTLTLDELAQKMRGKPNTPVTLKILRDNQLISKTIVRAPIRVQDDEMVTSYQNGHLQITIEDFDSRFSDKLAKIMIQNPSKKLTIDLRNSAGGNFSEILSTLSIFLPPHKELFYSTNKDNREIQSTPGEKKIIEYIQSEKIITTVKYNNEVEIIVDETTHAGSLLFAYAMAKYYPNCKLIGDNSGEFGYLYIGVGLPKSADSSIDYALKIATGQFYTMDGKVLSGKKLFDSINSLLNSK